jgi:DNA ligase-associated metallophosphoesterase
LAAQYRLKAGEASDNFIVPMHATLPRQMYVAENILLDGRLALFHEVERWLVVSDLHFGYELSQRAAGRLFPLWGMSSITDKLEQLLSDYGPDRLIILGDLVHDRAAETQAQRLIEKLGGVCELIVIAGNHDRHLKGTIAFVESWQSERFHFFHGHCAAEKSDRIQIIGHYHPAGAMWDGAGLRLKFPAFVQQGNCWVMPAFSPWAGGTAWVCDDESRVWLCTPNRILRLGSSNGVRPSELSARRNGANT